MGEDEQRLIAELHAELAKISVTDFLLQSMHSISLLAYQRLGGEGRDLVQAKLAIDSLQALVPCSKAPPRRRPCATSARCWPASSSPTRRRSRKKASLETVSIATYNAC